MIQIRKNIFETNSSSSHSLVFCDNDTWNKFVQGKLYYNVLSRYHPEYLKKYPLEKYKWLPEDTGLNELPIFCTFKEIKNHLGGRSHNIIMDVIGNKKTYNESWKTLHRLACDLLFSDETFYTIDELEDYKYDSKKQEASLDYYFG